MMVIDDLEVDQADDEYTDQYDDKDHRCYCTSKEELALEQVVADSSLVSHVSGAPSLTDVECPS